MADSDGEYVQSDEDELPSRRDGAGRAGGKGKERARERWEASVQDREKPLLKEGADGSITRDLIREVESRMRMRLRQDTQPFQRGIIRHLILILDLSEAMLEKDMRPNRYITTLKYAQEYVREFFEQNPISQLCVLAMYDGVCIRVSELSGNPNDHVTAIQALRTGKDPKEPKGSPSLQNALEMSRGMLYHTPKHGTREVIMILGALLSLDPGDIHSTIRQCVKDRLRVSVIGMSGRLKICQEICGKTNAGDESVYGVAIDQTHFRELLMATTTPPVIRRAEDVEATKASLLPMGFPSRVEETVASLCACHGVLSRGGYTCSRCKAKVCSLPATCPSCSLTLILSTHLARSYHHLFPLQNWTAVSWARAREIGSIQCKGCLKSFPKAPRQMNGVANGEVEGEGDGVARKEESMASESGRYECESCGCHFCIDCDLFCHEVVHNCPGCLGGGEKKAKGKGVANGAANGVRSDDKMDETGD